MESIKLYSGPDVREEDFQRFLQTREVIADDKWFLELV
jgi:hypothetical protein